MSMTYSEITGPAVWTAADIGGKQGLVQHLSDDEAAALLSAVEKAGAARAEDLTAADFDSPIIKDLMASVEAEIMHGRGAIILSHPSLTAADEATFAKAYWGMGTHLGTPAIQSTKMDLIGRVEKADVNTAARGYMMDVELRPHTDFHEVLSLACVRKSNEGGESGFASSLAIHNIILAERPDLLPALYEGYYHTRAGNQCTEEKVPVFCEVDGVVSCYYHPLFIHGAAKMRGEELPADLKEALALFTEISMRPDVRAQFVLEPGEMVFWHNFVALHSREQFHDVPGHKRLLLRLWLYAHRGRPMHPAFNACAKEMDATHATGAAAIDYASAGTADAIATR